MITTRYAEHFADGTTYVEMYGLSTDTKPTDGIQNGSLFIEMDSGDCYFFDGDSEDWIQAGGSTNG